MIIIIKNTYNLLEVLGTLAAVPDKAWVVNVFCDWRLMTVLQTEKQLVTGNVKYKVSK